MLDKDALAERLAEFDREVLLPTLLKRQQLAQRVGEFKQSKGEPIIRRGVETDRLEKIAAAAKEIGLDPNLARSVLYELIGDSCKLQIELIQSGVDWFLPDKEPERYAAMKANLLALTGAKAKTYNASGGDKYTATGIYLDYENEVIERESNQVPEKRLAVDLGCATGRVALSLAPSFDRVVGYDISQDMIYEAVTSCEKTGIGNVDFQQVDLDDGIPLLENSVSFVVMNLGTASDMKYLESVLANIERVLHKDGRFVLSFYNKDAWIYKLRFITFDIGLAAMVDTHENCLTVHCDGRDYHVYAKSYGRDEATQLITKAGLCVDQVDSFPTIASLLQPAALGHKEFVPAVVEADRKQSKNDTGAYLIVTGTKV